MKIKLSKSDWELIGQKTGWIKKAQLVADFETISLGPTPSEEKCSQIPKHDISFNKMEVKAFIDQLKRMFPNVSPDVYFIIERNNHEFGTYYEAAIKYNADVVEANDYATYIENMSPTEWDAEARAKLEAQGYFKALEEPVKEENKDINKETI